MPFHLRRIEKNNNSSEQKQKIKETRKGIINERVRIYNKIKSEQRVAAIKELVEKGELTEKALRWKSRNLIKPVQFEEE